MSRPSTYPSNQSAAHLATCIASVDFACRTLEASNATLKEQTSDFSRLARVLRSKRHFDLVSEQEIRSAREHLSAEIAPQLKELILRADDAVERDERRAKTLKGKLAQQNARIDQLTQLYGHKAPSSSAAGESVAETSPVELQKLREEAQALRTKRKNMQREMGALEEEVKQLRGALRR